MNDRFEKNTGFSIWELCKELELRFSKETPLTTPDLMAYFTVFHLYGADTDHAWIFFLDKKYKLCREKMFLPKVVMTRDCADYIWDNADAYSYFFIAFVSEDLILNEVQERIHHAYSSIFQKNPGYLGMILVSDTMDYLCMLPDTE